MKYSDWKHYRREDEQNEERTARKQAGGSSRKTGKAGKEKSADVRRSHQNNQITDLVFVLDRSGSMLPLQDDTIGGFNSMLAKQKNLEGQCRVTTVLFDHKAEFLYNRKPIREVKKLNRETFTIGGMTSLYDAIGMAIERKVFEQRSAPRNEQADHVMFVIITDGYENSSQLFNHQRIRSLIEYERKVYDWEFVFLGANIDAETTAESLGMDRSMAASYTPDAVGTQVNYDAVSVAVSGFRQTGFANPCSLDSVRHDHHSRKNRS